MTVLGASQRMSSEKGETSPLIQLDFLNSAFRVCELGDVPEGMTGQIVEHYLQKQLRWELEIYDLCFGLLIDWRS